MLVANDKYEVLLTVLPEQYFHCPKSGIEKRFCDLTDEDCSLMLAKGSTTIQLVKKVEIAPVIPVIDENADKNTIPAIASIEASEIKDLANENPKPSSAKKSTLKKRDKK